MAAASNVSWVKPPSSACAAKDNLLLTWQAPPSPEELKLVQTEGGDLLPTEWPDVIIACRPEVAGLALGIKEASGGRTRVIQIQNPNDRSGHYTFDLSRFDAIVQQMQEGLKGSNVLTTKLALHDLTPDTFADIRATTSFPFKNKYSGYRFDRSGDPRNSVTAVLVGGSDEHLKLSGEDAKAFADHLQEVADSTDGKVIILTSRRTAEHKNILSLLANGWEDFLENPSPAFRLHRNVFIDAYSVKNYNTLLAYADRFIVTGDSLSMFAEAMATGHDVSVYDFKGKLQSHPLMKTYTALVEEGFLKPCREGFRLTEKALATGGYNEAPVVAEQVCSLLNIQPRKPDASATMAARRLVIS